MVTAHADSVRLSRVCGLAPAVLLAASFGGGCAREYLVTTHNLERADAAEVRRERIAVQTLDPADRQYPYLRYSQMTLLGPGSIEGTTRVRVPIRRSTRIAGAVLLAVGASLIVGVTVPFAISASQPSPYGCDCGFGALIVGPLVAAGLLFAIPGVGLTLLNSAEVVRPGKPGMVFIPPAE